MVLGSVGLSFHPDFTIVESSIRMTAYNYDFSL
jgi:hypothetical protein